MLDSSEFAEMTVQRHRALLWNNIFNVNLYSANTALQNVPGLTGRIFYQRNRSTFYRGASEEGLSG